MSQQKIPVSEYFPLRLKSAMIAKSLTQKELESISGIKQSSISAYLRGEMEPKFSVFYQLSASLNVSMEWLCGIDNTEKLDSNNTYLQAQKEIARLKSKLRSARKTLEGSYTLALEALKIEEDENSHE